MFDFKTVKIGLATLALILLDVGGIVALAVENSLISNGTATWIIGVSTVALAVVRTAQKIWDPDATDGRQGVHDA